MKLSEIYEQHLYGKQGETVFHVPYSNILADRTEGLKVFMRMRSYKDDRSKVLLAALACEVHLDMLLREIMPGYKSVLEGERETTFSQKIRILAAMAIVPKHLTGAANTVRVVRNAFAHDLDIDKLEDLDDKTKARMRHYYAERKIAPQERGEDLHHVCDAISYASTVGLGAYLTSVSDLNAAIRSPQFEEMLRKNAEAREQSNVEIIRQHASVAPSEPPEGRDGPF